MAEGTIMVIKVDLKCCKCYKKIKKILCKIPQIQDQVYDEKKNTVTIKVACCCCPQKMMQKIRCKGGKSIISIEIKPPKKPEKPKEKPPAPAPAPTPAPAPAPAPAPEPAPAPPPVKEEPPTKVVIKQPPHQPPKTPILVCTPGHAYPIPFGECCRECSEGRRGGPCEQLAYGRPPCYGGYYGRPVCDSWGGGCDCGCNRGYYCRNRCGYYYYCEENPSSCSIM
ncbi:protein PYRICULARIA ORYZAE RESISTANCE 21-like [Pistacia vera]|uniref:protein PYRICULARIA ORYZAE RESISTANCE 21-like n=1 Tax=Pistacia vera TaxID=55513 RepID=UPI001262B2F1|nr:protein PYRICULARIA ORYZAE RESISTANCE 21-like [Pistacia vera]